MPFKMNAVEQWGFDFVQMAVAAVERGEMSKMDAYQALKVNGAVSALVAKAKTHRRNEQLLNLLAA